MFRCKKAFWVRTEGDLIGWVAEGTLFFFATNEVKPEWFSLDFMEEVCLK